MSAEPTRLRLLSALYLRSCHCYDDHTNLSVLVTFSNDEQYWLNASFYVYFRIR